MNKISKYRCAGCQQMVDGSDQVLVAWNRSKISAGTTDVAFCSSCANEKAVGETGKSLSKRMVASWQ